MASKVKNLKAISDRELLDLLKDRLSLSVDYFEKYWLECLIERFEELIKEDV